jgi:hypothetical protein
VLRSFFSRLLLSCSLTILVAMLISGAVVCSLSRRSMEALYLGS